MSMFFSVLHSLLVLHPLKFTVEPQGLKAEATLPHSGQMDPEDVMLVKNVLC